MENKIQKMVGELLLQQLPEESVVATTINGVKLYRIEKSYDRKPVSYDSEIIIIANGEKRIYLGDNVYTYNLSRLPWYCLFLYL